MAGLPKSGLDLVAEGAATFVGDMGKATAAQDKFSQASTKTASTYTDANGRIRDANGRFVASANQTADAAASAAHRTSGSFDIMGKAASALKGVVVAAFAAAALAVGAFVSDTISTSIAFEKQMSAVGAVLQATPDQAAALNQAAMDIGRTTTKSATEAAQAFELLGQNGASATDILDGLGLATVQLAEATGSDMVTAADVASTTMQAFNVDASQLESTINGIAGVTTLSKFGIDDYRLALAAGGGAASAFGVSLDDFNTVMTATSTKFSSGSDAGTSFKTFLTTLVPKSNEAEAAMRQLGIITADGSNQFFDAQGNMRGMAEISQILAQATAGLSEEQKIAAFSTIFGTDAMRTAIGLSETGGPAFEALAEKIGMISAADMAAQRMDNLSGSIESAKGALETLQLSIGAVVGPIIRQFVDGVITPGIGKLQALFDAIQSGTSPVTALTSIFPGLSGAVQAGGDAFNFAYGIVQTVMPGIQAIVSTVLSAVMSFWQANGDSIMATARTAWTTIGEIVKGAAVLLNEILLGVSSFINAHGEEIQTTLTNAWTIISTVITTTLKTIEGLIKVATALWRGDFGTAWTEIQNVVRTNIEGAKTILSTVISQMVTAVSATASEFLTAARSVGSAIVDGIKSGISAGIAGIAEAARKAAQSAVDAAKRALRIGSPSKVFDEIGYNMSLGEAEGIERGIPVVEGSVRSMTAAAVDAGSTFNVRDKPGSNNFFGTASGNDFMSAIKIAELQRAVASPEMIMNQVEPVMIDRGLNVDVSLRGDLKQFINVAVREALTKSGGSGLTKQFAT